MRGHRVWAWVDREAVLIFKESMNVERLATQMCGPHIFLLENFKLDCLESKRRPTYWVREPRHGY